MRPSRSTLARASAVAVVLGALVVVGRLSGGSVRPSSPPTVTTVSLPTVLSPPSTTPSPVTARLRLGQVTAVTGDGDVVWAAHGCAISRVDAHTGRVVATVGLPPVRSGCWVAGMQAGAGALWVSLSGERLLRVDPRSNRVVATLAMANLATPAVTASGLWGVCCWRGVNTGHPAGWLVRVDPDSNQAVARVRLPGLPTAVGVGPSGVWVTGAGGPIWRVDPASGRVVATIRVPGGLGGLPGREGPAGQAGDVLVDSDAVWVSNPVNAEVLRIDPRRNQFQGRAFTGGPALVTADGAVWATSSTTLVPLNDQARREVSLGELGGQGQPNEFLDEQGQLAEISDLAASPGAVWVAAPAGLFRVDLARLRRADG
jgi:hypothetical protein